MDSSTFTAYTLNHQGAARLDRENELIRRQRARRAAIATPAPAARIGFFSRLLHFPHRDTAHRVASAH